MDILIGGPVEVTRVKEGTIKWDNVNGEYVVTAMINATDGGDFYDLNFGSATSRIIHDGAGNTAVYMPASMIYSVTGWVGDARRITFQSYRVPFVKNLTVFLGKGALNDAKKFHENTDTQVLSSPFRQWQEALRFNLQSSVGLGV